MSVSVTWGDLPTVLTTEDYPALAEARRTRGGIIATIAAASAIRRTVTGIECVLATDERDYRIVNAAFFTGNREIFISEDVLKFYGIPLPDPRP